MGSKSCKEIGFEELQSRFLEKGELVMVDVRNPDELSSQGAIPKAVNIPLPEVSDAFKNLNAEDFKKKYGFEKIGKIVFSCRSGRRAETAIENIKGIVPEENIFLYKGSFLDWEAKGGHINK